jgi:heme exporter protein B
MRVDRGLLFIFLLIFKRDLLLAFRHKMEFLNPLLFFILITLLFPLAITSDPKKLMLMGPGIIWIALLFANMLSVENIFTEDFEDGTLEQMALHPESFSILIFAKLISYWLVIAIPLLFTSLLLSLFFYIPFHAVIILLVSLLLGSPVLTFTAAIGLALTLGLQRSKGLLLTIMIFPLYLPILIFGAGAVNSACLNLPVASQLSFLAAFLTLSLTFSPFIISESLKINLE